MSDIRERVTAALDSFEKKLKESREATISPSQRWRVPLLIDTLTLMAAADSGGVERAFRTPSRETTQDELSEIATRASELAKRLRDQKCSVVRAREQLAQRLEAMHESTICALANTPVVRNHGEPALLNIALVRRGLPGLLRDDSTDRERLANELDPLAQAAAAAEAPDTTDAGPWPDYRAQVVADILAFFFREATGLWPTISTIVNTGEHYGLFLDLVRSIFKAMNIERVNVKDTGINIDRDAHWFARRAVNKLRAQEQKSTP